MALQEFEAEAKEAEANDSKDLHIDVWAKFLEGEHVGTKPESYDSKKAVNLSHRFGLGTAKSNGGGEKDSVFQEGVRSILIIGGSGSGKSTFLRSYYFHLWSKWKMESRIPIYIPLPRLQKPYEDAVGEVLQGYGFIRKDIELLKTKKVLFLFDAYDELEETLSLVKRNSLNRWTDYRMIVTCRIAHLKSKLSHFVFLYRDFSNYFVSSPRRFKPTTRTITGAFSRLWLKKRSFTPWTRTRS